MKGRGFVQNPSEYQVIPKNKSRYSLVIAASKRAGQIAKRAKEKGETLADKPLKIAINEITSGAVTIVEPDEQY